MKRSIAGHIVAVLLLSLGLGSSAVATDNPYRDHTERPIKALSSEQVDCLLAGRGMSFALAAELNGYPGPLHALEVAEANGELRYTHLRFHLEMTRLLRPHQVALYNEARGYDDATGGGQHHHGDHHGH